jgi:glucose/arabinose dehydrogenase
MVTRAVGKLMLVCALATVVWTSSAKALSLQPIGSGFEQPIYVTSDPGNPERLFVVEREGTITLLENGTLKPFADLRSVTTATGEGGLLSIALAPNFDSTGQFFLDYTDDEGAIHVAEMTASGSSAPLSSLRDVIAPIPHPEDSNHYGGQLQFGPEGDLFVSTGDGGGSNDEHQNAQNPERLLGKILRVTRTGDSYAASVWSLGLRNPFRFSFDQLTGAMVIGDVGQGAREEVDYASAPGLGEDANYGWNCMEGSIPGPGEDPQCAGLDEEDFTPPIFEYPPPDPEHGRAWGCAIIGGYVARGPGLGDLYGRYLYGDLCVGELRSFALEDPAATDRSEGLEVANLNSFGEDSCGRLYAVSGNGPVYRLEGEPSPCPTGSTPPPPPALQGSFVGIRATNRHVKRHRRALISTWVAPCNLERRGDPVTLWRGRQQLGTRHLDRVCSARFRPKISRRSSFRATVKADQTYVAAISRKLTVRPLRHHH